MIFVFSIKFIQVADISVEIANGADLQVQMPSEDLIFVGIRATASSLAFCCFCAIFFPGRYAIKMYFSCFFLPILINYFLIAGIEHFQHFSPVRSSAYSLAFDFLRKIFEY